LLEGSPSSQCARYVDNEFLRFELLDSDVMDDTRPIPQGFVANRFVPDGSRLPKVMADAFRYHKALFIPVIRKAKLECARYRVGRHAKGSAYLAAAPPPNPDILKLEYSIEVGPDALGLLGPAIEVRHGPSGAAGCSYEYRFVRSDSRMIEMIPTYRLVSSYHPDDVEVWYGDKRSCSERANFKQASTACE
jgi:hypothetical protein